MRFFLLFLTAISLAACVATSQSRDELIANMKSHSDMAIADSYVSSHRFEEVAANIERKWRECYSVTRTTTRTENGMRVSRISDTYHPEIKKVNNSLVEFTLRETTTGMTSLNNVPPGGLYKVALNVERLPGNKTKLSWYSNSGWSKSWEMNKQWSDGKNIACTE